MSPAKEISSKVFTGEKTSRYKSPVNLIEKLGKKIGEAKGAEAESGFYQSMRPQHEGGTAQSSEQESTTLYGRETYGRGAKPRGSLLKRSK